MQQSMFIEQNRRILKAQVEEMIVDEKCTAKPTQQLLGENEDTFFKKGAAAQEESKERGSGDQTNND